MARRRPPAAAHSLACALVCLVPLLLPARPAAAQVKVEKKPPDVEHKTFDPKSPPKDMPELGHGEVALCVSGFSCDTKVQVAESLIPLANGKTRVVFTVKSVTPVVGLKVVIWLPEGATDKVKAHEEGHRQIAERAYQGAEAAAKQAAAKLVGRRVIAEERVPDDAEKAAGEQLRALNQQVADAYLEVVKAPTDRVQELYDDLTAHGTKETPDEATAIRLAFDRQAEEAKAAATKPTTKPAGRPGK